ncbi:MBL fold metallo-hydrolase [Paucibacter sp. APW11]|uniref:MBL fold metallo-hydrolase n=1 Tax=Roseateles aquae TaxID=3077235 RepID=A0ABU3P8R7_9BURK|nr:MBL fold metallo-hydrolase [Paucibacter sp. APW11]MDT8998958.1 MBL fold metallo-hydrolase [Paucibacter sp. APW11]
MRFCSLGSGSGGNATVVEASQGITQTRLLIDCGFSLRELERRLSLRGLSGADLDGIFVTHEHGDHVGCALALAGKYRIPLWASAGTWRAIGKEGFEPQLLKLCRDGQVIGFGDLRLQPFAVPHDAEEPLQLRCDDGHHSLGIITDAGSISARMTEALQGCHALLLECNHDEEMLRRSAYPASLKKRILGSHGHLSNHSAADLLARCLHAGLHTVVAAHLSEKNNLPELALAALQQCLGDYSPEILIAQQAGGIDWLAVDRH